MRIGSDEHKLLFCNDFIKSHEVFDPKTLPWPELDELSLARLRGIPIWTMALEIEMTAGKMLHEFAQTEPDTLVRKALELQASEEERHGRLLAELVQRYGLTATPNKPPDPPTRQAFVDFGYNECVDSFAGFGIFKLACDARILPDSLTALFSRLLFEEARHIVFFVNWIAWDRYRRGYGAPLASLVPTALGYGSAILRRIKEGANIDAEENETIDLFGAIMDDLTPAKFIRSCLDENARYMREFDPRLLRPRAIPAIAQFALTIIELVERLRDVLRGLQAAPLNRPGDAV